MIESILRELDLNSEEHGVFANGSRHGSSGKSLQSFSPINGAQIGSVSVASESDYEYAIKEAQRTFLEWRLLPAPRRGEIIREIGDQLRRFKEPLGKLVSLEMGKIKVEGVGEVQEAIDVADFAVGLSRQLYGKTMHSERPNHRMYEQWHPLGVVGVITAFNFPVAVWAWNSMIAAVCGNVLLWKPSEITPFTSIALNRICSNVAALHGYPALFTMVIGDGPELGVKISQDRRVPLVSATGSCKMGRAVATEVGKRLGRTLLELGGNNALIVMDDADMELAIRSVAFGAVGTAGQRCTSTRRVFLHRKIKPEFTERLIALYGQVPIGDPLEDGVLMGPLINEQAVASYESALDQIRREGGKILCGGSRKKGLKSPLFVEPTVVEAKAGMEILETETFAPILYLIEFDDLDDAIAMQNDVPQGLSSAILTKSLKSAERFLACNGSDCGIANVNMGTSGAEIGGAFGGEKDTGGGRESGSDSWKQYMRRQTVGINYGDQLPLAQGIKFDL